MAAMASLISFAFSSETKRVLLTTCETVETDTPARRATSAIVGNKTQRLQALLPMRFPSALWRILRELRVVETFAQSIRWIFLVTLLISPQAGEMAGRPAGGAV